VKPRHCVALAVAVLALAGCNAKKHDAAGASTSPAPTMVKVYDCNTLAYKPTHITLACADANLRVEKISWSSWGTTSATGTATVTRNTCEPYCAAGKFISYSSPITLDKPVADGDGMVFSHAQINDQKGKPESDDLVTRALP
jgi:hypothetical protein